MRFEGEAKDARQWLRHGCHVVLAYVVGFFVMLAVIGFHPSPPARGTGTGVATSGR